MPSITTGDQSGSQSYQSLDQAGNLLEGDATEVFSCHNYDKTAAYPVTLFDFEAMSYPFNQPYPNYFPQGTLFQDSGGTVDATYNVGPLFHFSFDSLMIPCDV